MRRFFLLSPLLVTTLLTVGADPTPDAPAGEAEPKSADRPSAAWFESGDVLGLDFRYFNGSSGAYFLPEISCGGAALFDYDQDGDLDVFFVQGQKIDAGKDASGSGGDRLFRNDLNGGRLRFVDVTEASGIRSSGFGCGVAAGDFDGDGLADLYTTRLGSNQLWRNNGDGTFRDITAKSGADDARWSASASFVDLDRDGWLDLYVANYVEFSVAGHKTCRTAAGAADYCDPAAYPGVPDSLFRNRGDGTFEDISDGSGISRIRSKSLGAIASALSGDPLPDVYVANDGVANQLWVRQKSGAFADEALLAGAAVNGRGQAEASMGLAAADFDRDGDIDLFMTHLTGETNTLFVNDGRGGFDDRTVALGLGPPSWAMTGWGAAWIDVENDGRLDLLVVNGAVRTVEQLAQAGDAFPFHQPNQLFRQLPSGRFEDSTERAGDALTRSATSRGLAVGDIDNDGDLDALVVNINAPAQLLINRVGQSAHWLGLRLVDRQGRPAIGARATRIDDGKERAHLEASTDGGFASAKDPRLIFGLGKSPLASDILVRWPDGREELWQNLPPDRYSTLQEGSGRTRQ